MDRYQETPMSNHRRIYLSLLLLAVLTLSACTENQRKGIKHIKRMSWD
jgi:hypothetical protein